MSVDMTLKKANALQAVMAFSNKALPLALAIQEFVSQMTDDGFLTGGGNAITDADCLLSPTTSHLTAALVNSAVSTALASVTLSTGNKTIIRQAIGSITPPS